MDTGDENARPKARVSMGGEHSYLRRGSPVPRGSNAPAKGAEDHCLHLHVADMPVHASQPHSVPPKSNPLSLPSTHLPPAPQDAAGSRTSSQETYAALSDLMPVGGAPPSSTVSSSPSSQSVSMPGDGHIPSVGAGPYPPRMYGAPCPKPVPPPPPPLHSGSQSQSQSERSQASTPFYMRAATYQSQGTGLYQHTPSESEGDRARDNDVSADVSAVLEGLERPREAVETRVKRGVSAPNNTSVPCSHTTSPSLPFMPTPNNTVADNDLSYDGRVIAPLSPVSLAHNPFACADYVIAPGGIGHPALEYEVYQEETGTPALAAPPKTKAKTKK
ncbi:hypothetical protein KIPB_009242, partial [Kipferlia bialata]|eukprot:g9242.t1